MTARGAAGGAPGPGSGTTLSTTTSTNPGSLPRSTGAVLLGLVAVFVFSLGTDQVLHWLDVYPPWGQPMRETGLNLLALSYRCVFAVVGSYVAARYAPRNPMRHALVLGLIGVVLSTAGAMAATKMDVGPLWYPSALVLIAMPGAWLGGVLHRTWHRPAPSPE